MSELQANVVNLHGVASCVPEDADDNWRAFADFKPLEDFSLKLVSTGKVTGRPGGQDADFAQWLNGQTRPVWADVTPLCNREGLFTNVHDAYLRTKEPVWPHQGYYTRSKTVHRRFVQVEGHARFAEYDTDYRTPIFVARLALNGGWNRHYPQIEANLAQLLQPLRTSKLKDTRRINNAQGRGHY